MFAEFMGAFEEFKRTNDGRLAELEKRGSADALTEEKLGRLNTALDGAKAAMDRVALERSRPALYFVDTGSQSVLCNGTPCDPYGSIYRLDLDRRDPAGPARELRVVGNRHLAYRAKLKVVFQNKVPTCQYRGVGHPIACAVTEALVDGIAAKIGMDPIAFREANVIPDDAYPATGASGIKLEIL